MAPISALFSTSSSASLTASSSPSSSAAAAATLQDVSTAASSSKSHIVPVPSLHLLGGVAAGVRVDTSDDDAVTVKCEVRTRIPSEWGGEHHVLLYSNDRDSLEHLALVWGYGKPIGRDGGNGNGNSGNNNINNLLLSRSLEAAQRPGETRAERAVRGCAIADADDVGSSLFSSSSSSPSLSPSSSSSSPTTTLLSPDPLLARIHSCCFTGETLGSLRCDCKEQLQVAMQRISSAGAGVVVYLQQEGRGIGLQEKLKAYNLIDRGYDTLEANVALGHPADARTYRVAAAILRDLGVGAVKLLTNNPDKMAAMERDGVVVDERVPMLPESWSVGDRGGHVDDRDGYLITKAKRMGHMIDVPSNVLKAVTENGSGLSTVGSNGSPTPSL